MFGWFKKKPQKKIFFVNIEIPAALSPTGDRSEAEDLIENFLQENNLGEVDGGGTFLSEDGQPIACDINVILNELNVEHYNRLAQFIKTINLPKGSKLSAERGNYYSDEELQGFSDIILS